jgi:tRNA G37 N-methylase TrmD
MKIDVVTLFPDLFTEPLRTSLLGRAVAAGVVEVGVHDLRAYGLGPHRTVDDTPYGGGAGMVLRPEPVFAAVEAVAGSESHIVLLSPRGRLFDQGGAARLAGLDHLVLICGRYEGVDERVATELADQELSIGDYVIAGGELAALVVIEAVTRLPLHSPSRVQRRACPRRLAIRGSRGDSSVASRRIRAHHPRPAARPRRREPKEPRLLKSLVRGGLEIASLLG